jgi:hypothetical protein
MAGSNSSQRSDVPRLETLVLSPFNQLTRLLAREYFIVKSKVVSSAQHVDIWRSSGRSVAPCTLNLGTRCMRVVSFMLRPHYRNGRSNRYSLKMGVGGHRNRPSHCGEDKNKFDIPKGVMDIGYDNLYENHFHLLSDYTIYQ